MKIINLEDLNIKYALQKWLKIDPIGFFFLRWALSSAYDPDRNCWIRNILATLIRICKKFNQDNEHSPAPHKYKCKLSKLLSLNDK